MNDRYYVYWYLTNDGYVSVDSPDIYTARTRRESTVAAGWPDVSPVEMVERTVA